MLVMMDLEYNPVVIKVHAMAYVSNHVNYYRYLAKVYFPYCNNYHSPST